MTYYEVLLLGHVVSAILWLGAAVTLHMLSVRLVRTSDSPGLTGLMRNSAWLTNRIFIPASITTLLFGILLTIEGPWSFGDAWILIGLGGYALSFLVGMFVLDPQEKKLGAIVEEEGAGSPAALAQIQKLFVTTRFDLAVLAVVVGAMTLKPTGDDAGTLALMGAAVVGALAYSAWRFRAPDIAEASSMP